MPFPQNVATARQVEAIVQSEGATSATIAIINGIPHIGEQGDCSCSWRGLEGAGGESCVCISDAGLSAEELEQLGRLGKAAVKTSRRDIAAVVGGGGKIVTQL